MFYYVYIFPEKNIYIIFITKRLSKSFNIIFRLLNAFIVNFPATFEFYGESKFQLSVTIV